MMKAAVAGLRRRWRQIPTRTRVGIAIAVIAIAGMSWQHYFSAPVAPQLTGEAAVASEIALGGHAIGEYQPEADQMPPAPDFSSEAARATVVRLATNFASPQGGGGQWLAAISADVMPELADQYRLTDLRNVDQARVLGVRGPLGTDWAAPTFAVDYSNGSTVEITAEMAITGWKVSTVVPVDPPAESSPADPDAPQPELGSERAGGADSGQGR
ncbi:MAG: hypothetical protein K0U84_20265 [Actinomycetia bacterium]|nr:hypothetical protein [Actinomycetes bacterium]